MEESSHELGSSSPGFFHIGISALGVLHHILQHMSWVAWTGQTCRQKLGWVYVFNTKKENYSQLFFMFNLSKLSSLIWSSLSQYSKLHGGWPFQIKKETWKKESCFRCKKYERKSVFRLYINEFMTSWWKCVTINSHVNIRYTI